MHIHTAQTWIEREGLMVYVQTPHLQVPKEPSSFVHSLPSKEKFCQVETHCKNSRRWRWTSKK